MESRVYSLINYIEVIPQMANKYNHLAICLACVKFTNTKNVAKHISKNASFLKKNMVKMH